MSPQTVNLLLYLLFWAVFVLGTAITFKLAAALVSVLDEQLPGGCPAPPPHLDAGYILERRHVHGRH